MSVLTRILTPFRRAAGRFAGRVVGGVSKGFLPGGDVEMLWQRLGLTVSQDRVTRPYGQNAWVHSAISAKATNIAGVPLRVFMGRRGTEQKQPVADTDSWVKLLTRPGPLYRNWPSFIGAVSAYLDLYGEAPMLALGPEWKWTPGTVPDELYLASPSRLEPEIDLETQILLGWWITDASGLRHQVSAAQLGMIALFNPDSPIRGMSPLVAAALGMDFDYSAHNFNVALMRNGADPGGLVKIPGAKNWTKEQTEAMRLQWEDRHKGSSKGGRVAVVDKEIDYLPTTTTHKGMQFSESRQWSRDEVKAVLKVTDLELGDFAGQTFANAAESRRWLWEQSLVPRMRAIEEHLWSWLFMPYSEAVGVNVWPEFDLSQVEALRTTRESKLTSLSLLVPHLGVNRASKYLDLGLPEVPWGDEPPGQADGGLLIPGGEDEPLSVPADAAAVQDTALNGAQIAAIVDIVVQVAARTLPAESAVGLILVSFPTIDEAEARRIVEAAAKQEPTAPPAEGGTVLAPKAWARGLRTKAGPPRWQARAEARVLRGTREWLRAYEAAVLASLPKAGKAWAKDLGSGLISDAELRRIVEQSFSKPLKSAITDALGGLKGDLGGFAVIEPTDPEWFDAVRPRLAQMVQVSERMRKRLNTVIGDYMEANQGDVAGLQKEIQGRFKTMSEGRALTIARTETGMVQSETRFDAMKEEGIEQHVWSTGGDAHVRESHAAIDGEEVEIGKAFGNGLKYPQDPTGPPEETINCRCVALPL